MNLSKGLIGETNANLLGSMLITRLYLSAMSRADLPVAEMAQMPNFYFYVDEFQSFANETFANILSEARKYKLNLTIAHQYVEQMEEEVKNAVFGNVGTIVTFRVGPFDAEVLETIFQPKFYATDIVNLGFAQIYLTLMIDGIGSQPFSAVTLPPIEAPKTSCKHMVIASSRGQYTKGRTEVESAIEEFHQPVIPPRPAPKPNNTYEKKPADRQNRTPQDTQRPRGNVAHNNTRKDTPHSKHEARKPLPPKQKTQSLDELRSVLKNISTPTKEKKKDVPKQKNTTGDLKSALKDALKEKKEKPKPRQENVTEVRENIPAPEHAKSVSNAETDSVSAKELERMMRVTSSDRPPRL
jgi:hypothetical protein